MKISENKNIRTTWNMDRFMKALGWKKKFVSDMKWHMFYCIFSLLCIFSYLSLTSHIKNKHNTFLSLTVTGIWCKCCSDCWVPHEENYSTLTCWMGVVVVVVVHVLELEQPLFQYPTYPIMQQKHNYANRNQVKFT